MRTGHLLNFQKTILISIIKQKNVWGYMLKKRNRIGRKVGNTKSIWNTVSKSSEILNSGYELRS